MCEVGSRPKIQAETKFKKDEVIMSKKERVIV